MSVVTLCFAPRAIPGACARYGRSVQSSSVAEPRTTAEGRAPRRVVARVLGRGILVLAASLLLGGATSFAQTVLPTVLQPMANSSSGWTLLTALLVWAARERAVPSAVYGALSFVALVLGYQVVSELRGFPTSEELFLVVGVVAGPFVGVAACWLHRRGLAAALGAALLAGVGIGEGVYGLTRIAATTGWLWWATTILLGVALLALVLARRARRPREIGVALVGTALVAVAFNAAYTLLG